jgi:hypothetical protein
LSIGLALDLRIAVLEERLDHGVEATVNVPPSGSMSRNGAGSSPPNEERLCPTSGR